MKPTPIEILWNSGKTKIYWAVNRDGRAGLKAVAIFYGFPKFQNSQ